MFSDETKDKINAAVGVGKVSFSLLSLAFEKRFPFTTRLGTLRRHAHGALIIADRCRVRMDPLHSLRWLLSIVSSAFSHQVSLSLRAACYRPLPVQDLTYRPILVLFAQIDQPLGLIGL